MKILKLVLSPSGLLIISLIILVLGKVVFHKDYLNCFGIIRQHIKCFTDREGKISRVSIFLYFGIPIMISLSLVQIKKIDGSIIDSLTVIVSIITSMFFTLLTLILDMYKKVKTDVKYNDGDAKLSAKLLKETYYAIMFEILISIVILIMCFVNLFSDKYSTIESLILYDLVFTLLTNLFMILKRVFSVIKVDLDVNS